MGSITFNAIERASENWYNRSYQKPRTNTAASGRHSGSIHKRQMAGYDANGYYQSGDWHVTGFLGVEGKGDIRPYTIGNFTVKEPTENIDTTNDRYGANIVFGMDFVHGKCLTRDPRLTLGFATKLGTDADLEVHGDLKTIQNVVKPGFAITSETSIRAQGGLNWQEAMQRQDKEHSSVFHYEGDIKTGPLLRWDRHTNKIPMMVNLRPYVGAGFKGKTVSDDWDQKPTQTKIDVQALVGTELKFRFIDGSAPGLIGGYFGIDVNNMGGSIKCGYGF